MVITIHHSYTRMFSIIKLVYNVGGLAIVYTGAVRETSPLLTSLIILSNTFSRTTSVRFWNSVILNTKTITRV